MQEEVSRIYSVPREGPFEVSIVVCAPMNSKKLSQCLKSIQAQKDVSLEVLLVKAPDRPKRELGWAESIAPYVFFLDADCELSDQFQLKRLLSLVTQDKGLEVLGGRYLNAPEGSILQKSYNHLCNRWLAALCDSNAQLAGPKGENSRLPIQSLLGGSMLVKKNKKTRFIQWPKFIGGEDAYLARQFLSRGIQPYLVPEMSVYHSPSVSIKSIVKRAWQQGLSRGKHEKGFFEKNNRALLSQWISSLRATPISFLPTMVLHFSIVALADFIGRASK